MKFQLDLFLQHFPIDQLKRKGTECPWCYRGTKAYGYELDDKLVSRGIKILEWCINNRTTTFIPKVVFGETDTEFNKLKYWHILEKVGSKWRITRTGNRFLTGKTTLPSKIWVYDDRVIEQEDIFVHIDSVEPRWKFMQSHWKNDYILYPHGQGTLLV